MRNTFLIVCLLFISGLLAQEQERKFNMEINQDFYVGKYFHTNETGIFYKYKINPRITLKLGWIYVVDREDYLQRESNFGVGGGYLIPLNNYCGFFNLELFSLLSNDPFNYNNLFDRYNIDLGVKLIYKKLIFMNSGLRYMHDEWSQIAYMQHITGSFGFFTGFGLILDFEKCSAKNKINTSKL